MSISDWDRTQGLGIVTTYDDEFSTLFPGVNSCILLGGSLVGYIMQKSTVFSKVNQKVTCDLYSHKTGRRMEVLIGLRTNQTAGANHGDGYWVGLTDIDPAVNRLAIRIWKREAGVMTLLEAQNNSQVDSTIDQLIGLEAGVYDDNVYCKMLFDGDLQAAASRIDSTFSGAGSVGVGRFSIGQNKALVTNFKASELTAIP